MTGGALTAGELVPTLQEHGQAAQPRAQHSSVRSRPGTPPLPNPTRGLGPAQLQLGAHLHQGKVRMGSNSCSTWITTRSTSNPAQGTGPVSRPL